MALGEGPEPTPAFPGAGGGTADKCPTRAPPAHDRWGPGARERGYQGGAGLPGDPFRPPTGFSLASRGAGSVWDLTGVGPRYTAACPLCHMCVWTLVVAVCGHSGWTQSWHTREELTGSGIHRGLVSCGCEQASMRPSCAPEPAPSAGSVAPLPRVAQGPSMGTICSERPRCPPHALGTPWAQWFSCHQDQAAETCWKVPSHFFVMRCREVWAQKGLLSKAGSPWE